MMCYRDRIALYVCMYVCMYAHTLGFCRFLTIFTQKNKITNNKNFAEL